MPAPRRTTAILMTCATVLLTAGTAAAAGPQTGTYVGHSSTNVAGNDPLNFTMTISRSSCAKPGGKLRHTAFCVIVDAASLIQSPCAGSDFVADAFFPATEPIALSSTRSISHRYSLYSSGGQIYDRVFPQATKVGFFALTLKLTTHGSAAGSMHYSAGDTSGGGTCDSGVVSITAKRKR